MGNEHMSEAGCNLFGGPRVNKVGTTNSALFRRRVEAFLRFVWNCGWGCIAVVGHSLWFRNFVALASGGSGEIYSGNACLWELVFGPPLKGGDGLPVLEKIELLVSPDGDSSESSERSASSDSENDYH